MTIIFALAIATGLIVFLRVTTLVWTFLNVAKKIHNKYISIVLKAPINLFFDVTPVGKILNRFSKDLSVIDEDMCFSFGSFLALTFMGFGALIVSCVTVPWSTIVTLIALFIAVKLFVFCMPAYKDTYRIEAVSWSPFLSYLQETFKGNTVIRAFRKEDDFSVRSSELMNKMILANQLCCGVFGWYSIRSDLIATFMIAVGCISAILLRNQISPVMLGLMLQYLLTL